MFIPEAKRGNDKNNDREECLKSARTLAKELANTFGGDVGKLTDIVDEILDTAFMANKAYEYLVSFCGGVKETSLLLATQSYIIVMGKISGSDIPIEAMPRLANAVFKCMSFWDFMPAVMEKTREVLRFEDMNKERNHGND